MRVNSQTLIPLTRQFAGYHGVAQRPLVAAVQATAPAARVLEGELLSTHSTPAQPARFQATVLRHDAYEPYTPDTSLRERRAVTAYTRSARPASEARGNYLDTYI